jgi:16S rRNA (uracil1498-N3)-methyltransferase
VSFLAYITQMTSIVQTRLYVEHPLGIDKVVPLNQAQTHYIRHVLRLEQHAVVEVFNGQDGGWLGKVHHLSKKETLLTHLCLCKPQQPIKQTTLYFALLKKEPTDFVMQKSVELGVGMIQPIITHRTQTHRLNMDRAHANLIEAAEQTGRLDIPVLYPPLHLQQVCWPPNTPLIFCDEQGGLPIKTILEGLSPCAPIGFIIGPEGGFDAMERSMLKGLPHLVGVSLGSRLLRAETASLVALAAYQVLCGDEASHAPSAMSDV